MYNYENYANFLFLESRFFNLQFADYTINNIFQYSIEPDILYGIPVVYTTIKD